MQIFRISRNQSGQVVVILALIFPFLMLLIAMLANVGLLVHQKIRLQNAVDAGVYTASASMARDLNTIAMLNDYIRQMLESESPVNYSDSNVSINWDRGFTPHALRDSFNGKQEAKDIVTRYQGDYDSIIGAIVGISGAAYSTAESLGRMAMLLTYFNGDQDALPANTDLFTFRSISTEADKGLIDYSESLTPPFSLGYVRNAGDDDCSGANAQHDAYCGHGEMNNVTVNKPITKTNKAYFCGAGNVNAGFSFFSANRFGTPDPLTAAAAGQPYGGVIAYNSSSSYKAALVQIAKANCQQSELDGVDKDGFYH
ncbi:MAG: pilus assembly protein TadG-related protein [Pseudomonadota bacterium]